MRVDGPGATEQANKLKKKQQVKGSGGGFDTYLSAAGEAEETSSASGVAELSSMSALLSLQDLNDMGEVNAKEFKRGEDILEQLNDLRMGLLSGIIPPDKLTNLTNLIKTSQQEAIDPQLQEILKDIEVRALVELEKIHKAQRKKA